MLLNKKTIVFGMMFLLFAFLVSAEVCEVDRVKQVLKKILFLYYTEPGSVPLTKDEVKDMLVFYLSIKDQNLTVDCSVFGSRSNKPISDVVNAGDNVADKIPSCADGTKYGECSKIRPAYCYAGAIYSKCDLCGCPTNSVCGKSQKCESTGQNITCFKDIDCGQVSFTGSYYCANNYIVKDILNYTCANPGTVNSKCVSTNGTIWLTYCNPSLNQVCVYGKSTCQATINDSAPTVSISVNPTTVAQGQFFNVTVIGTDDVGLTAIWWWAASSSDLELNKAHWYTCNGAKFCTYSWIVSTNATGVLTLGANSRDTAYPTAGQPHQASEGAGIAYATLTVTSGVSNATPMGTLAIKGRLVDYFTKQPIANGLIYTWDSQTVRRDTYTNSNGEFSTTADTAQVTATSPKPFGIEPNCYNNMGMGLFRNSNNSLYVNVQINQLIGAAKSFTVTGSEINVGDIPMWPAVGIQINSDIAVKFNLEYSGITGPGNSLYKTLHYLSYSFPLTVDTRTKLTDQANNVYYSPYLNMPLSNGCTAVNLNFYNGQFSWNTTTAQANSTNQTTINQTCTDSDGGKNYYVKGSVPSSTKLWEDYCDAAILHEFYCNPLTTSITGLTQDFYACPYGCKDGACVNQTATCTDSDGGRNYYVKGTATGSVNAYDSSTDLCSGNYLTESFCLNGSRYQESYLCSGGCSDGACIQIQVTTNQTNQTTNQTGLKGYAESCTNGIECKSGLACISDPLNNNLGKCGWWGYTYTNFSQCSLGYYPSLPCMCGNTAISAGACNNGIFYWPPTQSGSSVGSSCTDSAQCSTGICIFGQCSYAVRCSPSTPGYCHDHEECLAYGASC